MNIYNSFKDSLHKEFIAIIDEKESTYTSFKTFLEEVDSFALHLQELGVTQNDKVLILEGMSHKLYIALVAIFKVGATAVFVDPSQSADFVNRACQIAEPKAMISSKKALLLKLKFSAIRQIKIVIVTAKCLLYQEMQIANKVTRTDCKVENSTPALMSFTSGSTGRPKAIVRSQQFLLHQYEVLKPHIELQSEQIDLSGLPIFLLANLFAGVTSVIADIQLASPKKINGAKLCQTIKKYGVNRVGASPALFERLLESNEHNLEGVTDFYMGGAPVMPSLLIKLNKKFPNIKLHVLYGSSEAEPISAYELGDISETILKKMRSGAGLFVGKIVSEIKLDFLKSGEIIVTGKHVVKEYYKNVGESENKLSIEGEIWHKTGDVGYLDQDENLWLLGRESAVIKKGATKIYPFPIEVATRELTGKMASLIELEGRVILLSETKEHNLPFEGVDEVRYMAKIPLDKRHNAKVDYVELKKLLN